MVLAATLAFDFRFADYPDRDKISERNIETIRRLWGSPPPPPLDPQASP